MDNLILISLLPVFSGMVISPFTHRFSPKYAPWLLATIALFYFLNFIIKYFSETG